VKLQNPEQLLPQVTLACFSLAALKLSGVTAEIKMPADVNVKRRQSVLAQTPKKGEGFTISAIGSQ